MNLRSKLILLIVTALASIPAFAQPISLKAISLLVSPSIPSPMKETAPEVLTQEIGKRSKAGIKVATSWPKAGSTIVLALATDKEVAGRAVPSRQGSNLPENKPEGYRILSDGTTIWVIGADSRGVLFGTGWLLRNFKIDATSIVLDKAVDVATSPDYPIRGHQLGYRHTANSYDAWSVEQYDQYIRELAIFGGNSIENIPLNDDDNSPHFKIKPEVMQVKMSELCQKYDMDYWVWTPATFELTDEKKRKAELEKHEAFYKSCPRLDHIFFPGGDPGDNHPSEVLPFLKDLQAILVKYHPKAKMWVSLQGFSVEQVDYFYHYLTTNKPVWLEGVVSGPGSPSTSETRFRLPKEYKHRQYPDITHTVRCEFPVERWDQAYALTLGREPVNPRPYFYARAMETYSPFTDGFVTYSDGCHDDVNKVLWNMKGWDFGKDVREILSEYGNFFFGKNLGDATADGIAALEHNWEGPLAGNGGVEGTLLFWQNLEKANPALNKSNWRWQMFLLRAYYDTYTRRRLIYEQALEKEANTLLLQAGQLGADKSMELALSKVNGADEQRTSPELLKKIESLCADLFVSIGFQTSVPKYQARGYERGCVLDFVNYPLNNRWWLTDEFKKIKALSNDAEKIGKLTQIATWENPGQGSFYDDISSVSKGPRVKSIIDDATDVAWRENGFSRERLSFQLYQRSPQLEYSNLDPGARYKIKIVGFGDALLRVDGERLAPIEYGKELNTFKEWIVPLTATQDGKISVSFDIPEESHLNWRQNSKISDIWLLKQ
jgi:hypothetical protein